METQKNTKIEKLIKKFDKQLAILLMADLQTVKYKTA